MQTDVLAYFTPAASHPLLGSQTEPLYDRYYADRSGIRRYPAYIGLVVFTLGFFGVWFERKASIPWVLMSVTLVLLALGPLLRLNGRFYPEIPMLYRSLSPVFSVIRLMRVPDRYNVFSALPVSVLTAYGVAGLTAHKRWTSRRGATLVAGLLGGLIVLEYLAVPVPLHDVSATRSFYAQLADEPGDFAVLNLPIDPLKAKEYMFNQVVHGRPILQGRISRMPGDAYSYLDGDPWLSILRHAQEMSPALSDVSRQLANLNDGNIRYIIIHKWLVGADRVAHWRTYLATEPRYEDNWIVVYSTSPQVGRDFDLLAEMTPGLGPISSIVSTDCLNPEGALEIDVAWASTGALDQDFRVAVSLVDTVGTVHQKEEFPLSTVWPTSQWSADSLAWGYYPLPVSSLIPSSEYTLRLELLDAETGRTQGQSMSIQQVRVQSEICDLAGVPEATGVNAVYGNQLRLLEYEAERKGSHQNLTLYWRSERRMNTDYKIFVHIFDPATSIPVAQVDAMPHQNAYPTTFWWPGETVKDVMSIALDNVAAGHYGIAIGVYDPLNGERLPLVDSQGQSISDGRLVLDETVEVR